MTSYKPASESEDDDYEPPAFTFPERPVSQQTPIPPRPSFITNRDFVPGLVVFAMFAVALTLTWSMHRLSATLGFVVSALLVVLLCEWERRARYCLGRVRQRAHFDPLNLVKLPTPSLNPDIEMEPPTPFIPEHADLVRSDPAKMAQRAQATISGPGIDSTSAVEHALINLLAGVKRQRDVVRPGSPPPPPLMPEQQQQQQQQQQQFPAVDALAQPPPPGGLLAPPPEPQQ